MASGATNALRGNSRAGGGEGGIQAWSLDAEAWNFSPHRPLHQPHQLPIRLHRLELREGLASRLRALRLHVLRPARRSRTKAGARKRMPTCVPPCGISIAVSLNESRAAMTW